AGRAHALSIAAVVLEKAREGVDAWAAFAPRASDFPALLGALLGAASEGASPELPLAERSLVVRFLTHCFASLEVEMVRAPALRLVSLPLWTQLNERARTAQLGKTPGLAKHWKHLCKKEGKLRAANEGALTADAEHERAFLPKLLLRLAAEAEALAPELESSSYASCDYSDFCCEQEAVGARPVALEFVYRALELLVDLLAQ
ncbi:hypothetical protein T492DRAFT_851513, partial [Pavlovales sp. CCMP2436]